MQTLSNLQRNISDKSNLELITFFILALIYESLTSIFPFLSPLFGVSFILWLTLYNQKLNLAKILIYLYIIFYEIDKDYFVLSFVPLFLFMKFYIVNFFEKIIDYTIFRIFIYILFTYIGYFLINLFLAYIFNNDIPSIGIEFIFYIIIDTILVEILLYEK